ncbi:uncharacterized protein TRAVEDRAFT_25841 [Trametes versicolor FP-101664 SS1]|uniref:uncharacterized protein n=1 Tax=Trametes versicolor (strain FP-101664) TaxID=717944 RepID=UPI000462197F|nr:uncharacterized protein TRAVEDRAFT_25841 [Trametes versicolor FP-101664 SS1]EIW64777.1 hypothetical protein TRAVEDRAFT_25841 [Trametes versicolor FP-101664 SS1]
MPRRRVRGRSRRHSSCQQDIRVAKRCWPRPFEWHFPARSPRVPDSASRATPRRTGIPSSLSPPHRLAHPTSHSEIGSEALTSTTVVLVAGA